MKAEIQGKVNLVSRTFSLENGKSPGDEVGEKGN